MLNAQIRICSALIYSEKHLMGIYCIFKRIEPVHFRLATVKPACCSFYGIPDVIIRRRIFDAFVKSHCNGRRKVRLYSHRLLRTHKDTPAVDMRSKTDTLLRYLAQLRKRKHLKAAAVSKHGSLPIEKLAYTAHFVYNVVAGTQVQMICV